MFLLDEEINEILVSFQHNQWVCSASEGRAQNVPHQGLVTTAQSEISQRLPPTGEKCFKSSGQNAVLAVVLMQVCL